MEDALPFFGIAAAACGIALMIWTAGRLWLRAKELENAATGSLHPNAAADLVAMLGQIEARLGRLEQSVDATAIDVERVAEAQRFAKRSLGAGNMSPVRRELTP